MQGGRTLANKGQRFYDPTSDTPGPGSYSLSKKKDWIKEVGRGAQSAPPSTDTKQAKGGMVGTINIWFFYIWLLIVVHWYTCMYLFQINLCITLTMINCNISYFLSIKWMNEWKIYTCFNLDKNDPKARENE